MQAAGDNINKPAGKDAGLEAAKRRLRQEVRAALAGLDDRRRAEASDQARERLQARPEWRSAAAVLLYAPLPGELDVWPLVGEALATGRAVFLPRFNPVTRAYDACQVTRPAADLRVGRFGIREPAEHCMTLTLNRLDLILVPGVAFDLRSRRLGRGGGFYDLLLAGLRGRTCGVAFDEQVVSEVPVAPHDVPVDCILTPTRWIES